jgi:transcriptional regulator with XRE-family HTH domain
MNSVIAAFKARRIELGWSQMVLADKLEKSQNTIWQWEAGKVDPRLHSLNAWAAALGLRLEAVLDTSTSVL